jgi:hypothetical protein
MEYLTAMGTTVPEGTSPAAVDDVRAADAHRSHWPEWLARLN